MSAVTNRRPDGAAAHYSYVSGTPHAENRERDREFESGFLQRRVHCEMCAWFSSFLLNAFVSRVKRRIAIRIVRFCRST
jgi:hypothetical protein